jgi:ribosomal protein S18 acetylase RimI-like enzyme
MGMLVRQLLAEDRPAVHAALNACGAFSAEEVRVALEMVDCGLDGDYSLPAVEADGAARGYACIGKAALTASTWYVYWICVHPLFQGRGIGRSLQARIEALVREAGGDRLVVETSGRPDYTRTRWFYQQAGFAKAGRIPNFYGSGDDCVIYCKVLE